MRHLLPMLLIASAVLAAAPSLNAQELPLQPGPFVVGTAECLVSPDDFQITEAASTLGAGVGGYWVKPHVRANGAYSVTIVQFPNSDLRDESFGYSDQVMPTGWIGLLDENGVGVRARGWWFETESFAPVNVDVLQPGIVPFGRLSAFGTSSLVIRFKGRFQAETASAVELGVSDLEAVGAHCCCGFKLMYFGGLRWFTSKERYTAQATSPAGDSAIAASMDFQGLGPLIGYDVSYPCGHGFSLYNTGRLAVLYGREQNFDATFVNNRLPPPGRVIYTAISEEGTAYRTHGEIELGAEWAGNVAGCGLFVRAGGVGISTENVGLAGLSLSAGVQR